MSGNMRKTNSLIKIINNSLIDLPSPKNISYMWNFGFLLGMCLMTQIVTGLFLAMHYATVSASSFDSVVFISQNVNFGWLIRALHANGASWFFICLYLHTSRGLISSSFVLVETWSVGVVLLLLTMAAAFLGYVLPWGQMSFWAATVITNILSAIPYIGPSMVGWLWGGFAVSGPTLTRFFTFHFIVPFIILALVVVHLLFLHSTGSSNPIGIQSSFNKVAFHPYFSIKDILGMMVLGGFMVMFSLFFPYAFLEPENFILSNPLSTPTHIKPEWYFLWAYALLRAVPNKLGGVIVLLSSMLMLLVLPLGMTRREGNFSQRKKYGFWILVVILLVLTWVGANPVEPPLEVIGQLTCILYFLFLISLLWLWILIAN